MATTKQTKKQRMAEQILRHGLQLQRIFPATAGMGPVSLCKALRRIESAAHRDAERLCNGEITQEQSDTSDTRILKRLQTLLDYTAAGVPVIINGDPRGYALKIEDGWMKANPDKELHRDWGGYGILAPEFTGD